MLLFLDSFRICRIINMFNIRISCRNSLIHEPHSHISHLYLWFSCVLVGLDEDLADADIFADSSKSRLHGLPCSQDGHACNLKKKKNKGKKKKKIN